MGIRELCDEPPLSPERIAEMSRDDAFAGRGGRIKWDDRQGSRDRQAWLLLVQGPLVHVFRGQTIPGVVAVVDDHHVRDGKWSHTTWTLEIAAGVRPIPGRDGWNSGRFAEGLQQATGKCIERWTDFASALGVPLAPARAFLEAWRPKAAARLDEVERAIAEVDDVAPEGATELSISFGGPTRRLREAGFWSWPVRVLLNGSEIARIVPQDAHAATSHAVEGDVAAVRVLDIQHLAGHGGGHVSLRLAVPYGATAEHGPALRAVEAEGVSPNGEQAALLTHSLGDVLRRAETSR